MDITPAIPDGRKLIEAYAPGRFRISGVLYTQPVLVFGENVLPWQPQTPPQADDFAQLFENDIELVLFGTGAVQAFADKHVRQTLRERGMMLESMTSDAAARTYNVLLAEGRKVAAALLLL